MGRMIEVSTEVFAGIWAKREAHEESEDSILKRLLGLQGSPSSTSPPPAPTGVGGVYDTRNDVRFSEGFTIFRSYKGQEYRAEARGGAWLRKDDGKRYPTLNQLNASIAAGSENVWNGNWRYHRPDGKVGSIAELRR